MRPALNPASTAVAEEMPRRRFALVALALLLVLAAVAMMLAAAYLRERQGETLARSKALRVEAQRSFGAVGPKSPVDSEPLDVPVLGMHLKDVEALVRLADQQSVRLGALQFRSEGIDKSPYVLRVAEFRVEEEYPRLKTFLGELLSRLPHAYLDEVRVERGADPSGKVQASLRLSIVYLAPPAPRSSP